MDQTSEIKPYIASASPTPAPTQSSISGTPIKRRAPIACRRYRACQSEESYMALAYHPPQVSAYEDFYPGRGESTEDRQFRHPRQRADKKSNGKLPRANKENAVSPSLTTSSNTLEWDGDELPDVETVREGVRAFTRHFFQLGFIATDDFLLQVENEPSRIGSFLLVSILSISARFNRNYEAAQKVVQSYLDYAEKLALRELYQQPVTLERCQAFFLLSIAQHGMGETSRSNINMGIAISMATEMRLHREETFKQITEDEDSTREARIRAESARRTLTNSELLKWMLHSQDNLHSGPYKRVQLAASDITTLLPCDEDEFRCGGFRVKPRAALAGTPPADLDPTLTTLGSRSLFATLIQTHHIWGTVARRAVANEKSSHPGDTDSDYAKIRSQLADFEQNLPRNHPFDEILLPGYRQKNEDLAYLSACATLRLSNIVLRKAYLGDMIRSLKGPHSVPAVHILRIIANELFDNVFELFKQIKAQFDDGDRPLEEMVGSQMAAFCVYSCGLLVSYLVKFPGLYHPPEPIKTQQGKILTPRDMYDYIIGILEEAQAIWPLASSWLIGLKSWMRGPDTGRVYEGVFMADGKDPAPHAFLHPPVTTPADRMTGLLSPSFVHGKIEPKQHSVPVAHTEPAILPPLQSSQPISVEPPSLPPPPLTGHLSPTQQQPSPYHHPQYSTYPSQVPDYGKPDHHHHQHQQQYEGGLYTLHHSGHHGGGTPTTTHVSPQVVNTYEQNPAFMPDFNNFLPINDGFNLQLQQLMGTPWNAPDATAPLYTQHHLTDMSTQPPA
ncbi:hypothetical protein PG996_007025 [Apiospora saccharicola]|uniref:Xylanolytic transcriptional activator regulatory domain-containing protein n=1 Tax=Apiospora saccharicola TaxID=335842 RepID=A0ABR1V9S2_9PEZI